MARSQMNPGLIPRWTCVELEIVEQNAQCTLKRKIRQIIFGNIYVSETALKQQTPIRIVGNNIKYGDVITFLDNRRVARGVFVCSEVGYPNFGAEDIISELINQENEIRQFARINNCANESDSLFLTICKCYKFLHQRLTQGTLQNGNHGQNQSAIFNSHVHQQPAQQSYAEKLKNMVTQNQLQQMAEEQPQMMQPLIEDTIQEVGKDDTVKVEVFDDDEPVVNSLSSPKMSSLQMSGQMTSQIIPPALSKQLASPLRHPFSTAHQNYESPPIPVERKVKLTDLAVSALGESEAVKRRKEELLGDYELCVVCGDVSTGVHYGAETCEGCKGFFRRITQNNLTPRLCSNDNRCVKRINRRNRTQCPSCRFAKCVQVGMSRDKMDETKLRLPKKRQHITENKILNDDGKSLNVDKYPKLQPKIQVPRATVPVPSAVVQTQRLLEQAGSVSSSPQLDSEKNPLAHLLQNSEQTTLLQKLLSGQVPIEQFKNRSASPVPSAPAKTPTNAQEILELMRTLQNSQKEAEKTDLNLAASEEDQKIKKEAVDEIPEEIKN